MALLHLFFSIGNHVGGVLHIFADDTPLTNSQPAMMGMKTELFRKPLIARTNSIVGLRMAESTLLVENYNDVEHGSPEIFSPWKRRY